jgi:23S rRNA pseudouridine1911/1915/1917 synthase
LNKGFEYRERLGREAAGLTALDYLVRRYLHSTRGDWRERILSGRVLVEGRPAAAGTMLRVGQTLVWRRPPWEEPAAPLCFAILYRDSDLLAVAKPPGLPTAPAGGYLDNTLLSLVSRHDPHAHPVHRLDRGTSGVVLFARSSLARAHLSAAWRAGKVDRTYRALACGSPDRDRFAIERPIGRIDWPRIGSLYACAEDGRAARSEVRVLERRGPTSLLEVTIATGRPHQIRIHLAAMGHPLVGEPLYGSGGLPRAGSTGTESGDRPALPGDGGYLLHAGSLAFSHPRSARPVSISCLPPMPLRARSGLECTLPPRDTAGTGYA